MQQFPKCVTEFAQYMRIVKGRSEKTVYQYTMDLLTFFRFLIADERSLPEKESVDMYFDTIDDDYLRSVTTEHIMKFLFYTAQERKNGAAARARKLSGIKSFFKYTTVTRKITDQNPAQNIDTPKIKASLPKYLTVEESLRLLDAISTDEHSNHRERDYCIVTLFLNCGMRLSELTGIDLTDIDEGMRSLRVVGKGNKERVIYLNDACRDALKKYLPHRTRDGEPKDKNALFISRQRNRVSNQTVQKTIEKYLKAAGLESKHFSTHKLRHTAATLLYQTGKVDVRVLKDILGHEQLNTTQIYTHVSDSSMEAAMSQNPLSKIKND